ncbi:NAD(P)/FAD-dependent oxidoreductase [Lactobacillaceae bacterium Melli_B4]
MNKRSIAIVGGGILGSTVAYYLAENNNWNQYDVTLFDDDEKGQATKAAAGIISPWVSKRRNRRWYRLAKDGAKIVQHIAAELKMDWGIYQKCGTIITRDSDEKVNELFDLAIQRREAAPMMGDIDKLTANEINQLMPFINNQLPGIMISGGARMEGGRYAEAMCSFAEKRNLTRKKQKVTLTKENKKIKLNNKEFDKIIICTGAWTNEIIKPLSLKLDIYPQKGQLIRLILDEQMPQDNFPVLMPEGEYDIIPVSGLEVIVGATHENDQGFDLRPSSEGIESLINSANQLIGELSPVDIESIQVGTRSYTRDFAPYFGTLPEYEDIIVGGGLGSSGLTTGPAIAKLIAESIITGDQNNWDEYTKPVTDYLK